MLSLLNSLCPNEVFFVVVFFITLLQNVFSLIIKFIHLDAAELMMCSAQHRDRKS